MKWCDEGSEGGSCCCPRASAGAFCQLCALSAACWRQWECAAFMCQLGWRPWMLMLVVVPGLAPLDWLAFSLPMCSEGLQCCRTAPWHWHCCLVRLLAGLYESVDGSAPDGKEGMLGGQGGRLKQVVAASPQGSADIVVLRTRADGFFFKFYFWQLSLLATTYLYLDFGCTRRFCLQKCCRVAGQRCWIGCSSHI